MTLSVRMKSARNDKQNMSTSTDWNRKRTAERQQALSTANKQQHTSKGQRSKSGKVRKSVDEGVHVVCKTRISCTILSESERSGTHTNGRQYAPYERDPVSEAVIATSERVQ